MDSQPKTTPTLTRRNTLMGLALCGLGNPRTDCNVYTGEYEMLVGFSAHLNGINQMGCLNRQYTAVGMQATDFNDAGYDLRNNWWLPPAAGLVIMGFNVWINANACAPVMADENGSVVFPPGEGFSQCGKIHSSRDGGATWAQVKAMPGFNPAGYPGTAGSGASGILAKADGNTAFRLYMYTTSADGKDECVIDGNPAHTWFTGFYAQ